MRFAAALVLASLSACSAPANNDAATIEETPANLSMSNPVDVRANREAEKLAAARDDLYRYLVSKAEAASECSQMPADFEYCHPKPVEAGERDARNALAYMSNVDDLMAPCEAGDAQACFKQTDYGKLARQLGWCRKTSVSFDQRSNVLWARCGERGTIIVHEAK